MGCEHLRGLDLSGNGLVHIDPDAFSCTPNLKELHLHDNKLMLNSTEACHMFDPISHTLEILSIQNNSVYNDRLFVKLVMLRSISIEGRYDDFGRGFLSLTGLKKLIVYYGSSKISNDTLINFSESAITELKFVSSTLADLEPLSFSHFKCLEILDLSYNHKLTLKGASKSWYGLNFTNITTLILTKVNDEQNLEVDSDFFNYLENTKISKVLLDKNKIIQFTSYGFSRHLPGLKHLDLSFNRMTKVDVFVNDIYYTLKLNFLDCSYQRKRYISKRQLEMSSAAGSRTSNSDHRQHSRNNKSSRAEFLFDKNTCKAAVFKKCQFNPSFTFGSHTESNVKYAPFDENTWCIKAPKNLELLNLTEAITIDINKLPVVMIFGPSYIRHVAYKGNGLKMLTGPFMINRPRAKQQMTLDLGDNGITCFAKDVLSYSVSKGLDIGKLFLPGNDLGEQLAHDIEGETFFEYRNLSELNLARNQIKTLPSGVFIKVPHLKMLNLSGNSLQLIAFNYSHFDRLEVLDLSSNLLTQLDAINQMRLTKLIQMCHNLSISIIGNPLQCSCNSLDFLKWLKRSKSNVANYENTSCLYDNVIYSFAGMEDILNKLDFECSKTFALKIAGSLLALTILGIVFSIFLYRHRWDIRYCLLKFSNKGKKYQRVVDQSKIYAYDAFVAYDKDDRGWVKNELVRNLEASINDGNEERSRQPMRLCIHERDFELGNWIEENIVTAIEQSRRILLVVSNHFLNSNWCRFELEMARMHSMERGRNIVVPILLEDVPFEEMPASLQLIIRKHTYIEWKPEAENHEEFWDRLTDVMSNVENNAFVCECGRAVVEG